MKIVVLVKQVPDTYEERRLDPVTGILDREANEAILDEVVERALEVALRIKDAEPGTQIVLLSMGPQSVAAALRKALGLAVDSAVHVVDDRLAGADLGTTAAVLAAALKSTGYDLILAGNESTDGRGGVIPAMVAELLGLPHLTGLDSVAVTDERASGVRTTESGSMEVHAGLPAVVSVTERSDEVRFPSFKGIMAAKKKPIVTLSVDDLGPDPAASSDGWGRSTITGVTARAARTAGIKVVDGGSAGIDLAEYLATAHLI